MPLSSCWKRKFNHRKQKYHAANRPEEKGTTVKKRYFILTILTFILSACGRSITMSSTDQVVSGVYTAAASTSEAQARMSVPTSTPLPVSTATPLPTPTTIPPATESIQNHPSGILQGASAPIQVDYSLCNNAAYIDDATIPDGTVLAPGEVFVKSWILRNTGFCTWKDGYTLTLFEGNSMSGQDTEIGKKIASGREAKVSITLTAPDTSGTYTGYWILADDYGTPFGMPFFVQIVVKDE
jgi:hypothetical protein